MAVELPSGSVVGLAFAAGVSSALAATRLRRRKRRRIPPPTSGVTITPEPEIPESVAVLHRAHIKNAHTDQGKPVPQDTELVREAFRIDVPATATIGRRDDGTAADVALHGLDLALAGPGADDTARAIVLDLLTTADHYRALLIVAVHDAEALLGPIVHDQDIAGGKLPGLVVTATREDAVRRFVEEHRTRAAALAQDGAKDVRELLAADPGEVLPTVLLIQNGGDPAPVPSGDLARHGLGILTLGSNEASTICHIQVDGRVEAVSGALAEDLSGVLLFHVSHEDAPEILRIFAHSAGIDQVEPRDIAQPAEAEREAAVAAVPPGRTAEEAHQPVRLLILGVPVVEVHGSPIPLGRRGKAMELLIYLAIHWQGATKEQICAALWPDHVSDDRFHSTLRHLRDPLRRASGLDRARFVGAEGDRYRIEHEAVSVDLWDFQRALSATRAATDDQGRIIALRAATDLVRGNLAEGAGYDWIDEHRYPLTRAQIDALSHHAGLTEQDAPEQALELFERARSLDPLHEDTYRRIITLQLRLHRRDAAQRTARLLRAQLADLGLEPEQETESLLGSVSSAGPRPAG